MISQMMAVNLAFFFRRVFFSSVVISSVSMMFLLWVVWIGVMGMDLGNRGDRGR